MNRLSRWICYGLAFAILLGTAGDASARLNSGMFRRYMQQQYQMQQQYMMMEQKMMQEAMMRQAAMEKQRHDTLAKASKARSDKEEEHRQYLIAKRKADQATRASAAPTDQSTPKKSATPADQSTPKK